MTPRNASMSTKVMKKVQVSSIRSMVPFDALLMRRGSMDPTLPSVLTLSPLTKRFGKLKEA